MLNEVKGGVCAAKGFQASGVHAGVKASSSPDKNDLALILSEKECTAAGTYTLNRVKAAPVYVTMEHLEDGVAWGVVANSGNANACCPMSHENAVAMAKAAADVTGRQQSDFVVCSTGVIGQTINIAAIEAGLPKVAEKLAWVCGILGADFPTGLFLTHQWPFDEMVEAFEEVRSGQVIKGLVCMPEETLK
jgi:glutamate N-acetyltransferase/amino-acid N-acetyltransferase